MAFARELKRRGRSAVAPMVFLAFGGYFVWSAFQGDRGLRSFPHLQAELGLAQGELRRAEADRSAWERRVASLRPSQLDPDALDERGRAILNVAESRARPW